jgi:hypothetical protein
VRPEPPEILRGIGASLDRVVLPALDDPMVQSQVTVMVILLRDVAAEWDGEAERLRATITRWEDRLDAMSGSLARDGDPATSQQVEALRTRIATLLDERTDSVGLRDLLERRNALADVLAELLVECERSSATGEGAFAALRADAYATVLGS